MKTFRGSVSALSLFLMIAAAGETAAQIIDIVGDTSLSAIGASRAKANVYRVDTSTKLRELEVRLDFSGVQQLTYTVHKSAAEFGTFTQIYANAVPTIGAGQDYYSSGPINVPLQAGSYYMLGVSWPGTLEYYFDSGPQQATSFGAHVHAYATGAHPLGSSVSTTTDDEAIYNQRLTTIPEPATFALIAFGGIAAGHYGRRRGARAGRWPVLG
jgi:hypothetical protein